MNVYNSIKYRVGQSIYASKYEGIIKNCPLNIMNTKETLQKIIDQRFSFSRFGDGEFYIMWGDCPKIKISE